MKTIRLTALLLTALLATAFLNGSALADESQEAGKTNTETSAPADAETPPVDAPPPADTAEGAAGDTDDTDAAAAAGDAKE